ncbi:hypothetical protein I4F81_008435 [Pyropia yezoensis]|uniref:Uncharacterized protein n=1 Tax=Pyropia yezoensis TaxID=2788 RepID=A0ACC3C767_PYRYE|nr:hypothetical protein I4F81_008435 [Neopyropia yezoensis]
MTNARPTRKRWYRAWQWSKRPRCIAARTSSPSTRRGWPRTPRRWPTRRPPRLRRRRTRLPSMPCARRRTSRSCCWSAAPATNGYIGVARIGTCAPARHSVFAPSA